MPLDEQLLPNPALKPWYDRIVWLFVSRNFKDDAVDREALRTHERFGISSWPQMIVFDPIDDRVLLDPPRDLAGFEKALARASQSLDARAPGTGITAAHQVLRDPPADDPRPPAERLADPNPLVRARVLEDLAAAKPPERALLARAAAILARPDEDVVVYLRALRLCARHDPQAVGARARDLLAIANDPLRYEVLDLLRAHPEPALAPLLNRLFAGAGTTVPSRNPNVLRLRVAPCLGTVGDAESIEVMAPIAQRADWRNGLTRAVLAALAELARRREPTRPRIAEVLLDSFPPANDAAQERDTRANLALVQSVLDALAAARPGWRTPAPPATWDDATRTQFVAAVRESR